MMHINRLPPLPALALHSSQVGCGGGRQQRRRHAPRHAGQPHRPQAVRRPLCRCPPLPGRALRAATGRWLALLLPAASCMGLHLSIPAQSSWPAHSACCKRAQIRDKYQLRLPPYPGTAQCVRIGGTMAAAGAASTAAAALAAAGSPSAQVNVADMRMAYGGGGGAEASLDESTVRA